jgi:predicted nucleotidyltransferase
MIPHGLKNNERKILEDLVLIPLKNLGARVWVFGSRATGTHKKNSDIDLLYQAEKLPIPDHKIYEIKSNLEESNFPFVLDLVDFNHLAQAYKDDVLKERKEL